MSEAKRKPLDKSSEDSSKSGDSSEIDSPKERGGSGGEDRSKDSRTNYYDPPSHDDDSMAIDPPDNTGSADW